VLAATQWQRFPAAGQYGILWTYTLTFWGIGFWAFKQENLQLTAQTLQTISLLLMPLNFWAIDTFNLWRHPLEWLVVAIASVSLSAIYLIHNIQRQSLFVIFNYLGLCYLHWGWRFSDLPLVAVYIGAIPTTIAICFLEKRYSRESLYGNQKQRKTGKALVVFAFAVLLVRAIFVVHLPIQQLGLAVGICGWLLTQEGRREGGDKGDKEDIVASPSSSSSETSRPPTLPTLPTSSSSSPLEIIGGILLFLGWLVSVTEKFPWQATAVSGLALHFCSQRLRRYWLRRDLFAIFVIGLQGILLVVELIPVQLRQTAIGVWIQIADAGAFPDSIFSITLFPYVIFLVGLTDWLYRREKPKLAIFGEQLALLLGAILTLISWYNPTARSLNLFLSTITLAYVSDRRTPTSIFLVYFTHSTGLAAIAATIDWWFPSLTQEIWATILLVLMVAEWTISTLETSSNYQQIWYRSGWHLGFVLASVSYFLLLDPVINQNQQWGLLWLLTPLTLTVVASRREERRRINAVWFSCAALVAAQFLTFWQPGVRLVGLSFATGLMLVNTRYVRETVLAIINLGFALGFVAGLLWGQISGPDLFLVGAIAIVILWLLATWLQQYPGTFAALYAEASDGWAIFLCVVELTILTFHYLKTDFLAISPAWQYLTAPTLIGGTIIYRYWRQPDNLTVYGVGWAIETCLAEGILLFGGSNLEIATANIVLALLSLLLTNWWRSKRSSLARLSSLKQLPLIYALIGIAWRWQYFTAYTGWLTLGAAITCIAVGSRYRREKIITYLSLVGISLGCYELVIYQMLQSSGGSPADGLTILAVVAAAIALAYSFFVSWWRSRGRDTFLNLSIAEIKITAHIHWAISSILKVITAAIALESTPQLTPISIAVSLILAAYALIQGRDADTEAKGTASDWWVYAGIVEIFATTLYARLIWTELSILDPWRVILVSLVALFIYQIPWRSWGWQPTPWQRASLVIPALTALINAEDISYLSLLVVAAFYARIAIKQRNIRWSYLSLGFVDGAIVRFLSEQGLTDILWYALILGLSLLYIAQFDPSLIKPAQKQQRHYLRILAVGIICLVALSFHQDTGGIIPSIISLVTIFAGLGLRIRAFLFVGTVTFILTIFYQLVVLIFTYSFLKWVIGLIAGIVMISIAANFEKRSEQIITILQNWFEKLGEWQ
ncbi:MAG: hypothetical protein AB4038_04780, partial [Prochloraceae cyanobacterium]